MSLLTFTLPRTGQPLLCMCISYRYIHLEVAVEDELLILGPAGGGFLSNSKLFTSCWPCHKFKCRSYLKETKMNLTCG